MVAVGQVALRPRALVLDSTIACKPVKPCGALRRRTAWMSKPWRASIACPITIRCGWGSGFWSQGRVAAAGSPVPCPCPDKAGKKSRRGGAKKKLRTPAKRPATARHPVLPVALHWPIRGVVTQRFNQDGGRRHDGIDIAAPKGAIIRAAADGEVIFSDWGPGGYGRIVIVQHSPHLVTVYAHNNRNLVKRHQRVKRGQAIATVGRSGRASGYHVHFEIRFKTEPKPPFVYLPRLQQTSAQARQRLYGRKGTS